MTERNELRNATIGAVVTIVLSFTGVAPLVGGGVAGYLQRESPGRGLRVGAISGAVAIVPILVILAAGVALFVGGAARFGIPGGLEIVVVTLIFLVLVAWTVGLSAIGGYVGALLREDARSEPAGAMTRDPREE
jgi:hypothetical protein